MCVCVGAGGSLGSHSEEESQEGQAESGMKTHLVLLSAAPPQDNLVLATFSFFQVHLFLPWIDF